MKGLKIAISAFILSAFTNVVCNAQLQQFKKTIPTEAPTFQNGDRVTFIGNSITRSGGYHSNLFLFYATRFPEIQLQFFNCGISGDSSWGTVDRFSWDILNREPTIATIKLGTNDVGRSLYETNSPSEKNLADRQNRLRKHDEAMHKLVELLKNKGTKVIIILPSILDGTAVSLKPSLDNGRADSALAVFAEHDRRLAKETGSGIVDFRTIMKKITTEQQKINPAFTLINSDRIHPNAVGHMVMTYAFLKAQGLPKYVSKASINAGTKQVIDAVNCKVSALKIFKDSLSFNLYEHALPFPIDSLSKPALGLVPLIQDFNQEVLVLLGLKKSYYNVFIDGVSIGKYSANQLKQGVDLSQNKQAPQYKQAQEILSLNNQRQKSNSERSLAYLKQSVLGPAHIDIADTVEIKNYLKKVDAKRLSTGSPDFTQNMINNYLKGKIPTDAVNDSLQVYYTQEIYKVNKPKPHRYSIVAL